MNEHEHHHHETHHETHHGAPAPAYCSPAISWGAIIAGLFAVLSISWLLNLFGLSLGVSVTDASDDTLMDDGLPQVGALWMVISVIIAFFIGGAVAARMSRDPDETNGMIHGFLLWAVSTTILLGLGYLGFSSLVQTGQSYVSAAGTGVATVVSTTAQGAAQGASGLAEMGSAAASTDLAATLRERLQQQAAEAIAAVDAEGGPEVTEEDVRASIEELDDETIDQLVTQLMDDDRESAAQLIASQTDLTEEQSNDLIEGAYQALKERFGNPGNNQSLADDLRSQMADRSAAVVASLDAEGGPEVTKQAVREAINDLDAEQFNQAAMLMIEGRDEEAVDLLASETDLSEEQLNDIANGVVEPLQERIEAVKRMANEAVETASTYAQQVLWAAFATTALGLAVAVLGGWCGADASRRYYETNRVNTV
ncbi:hypothetical protein Mal64_13360 [Pseudobythopirellula maris]|uniref:Uncharacterized protein n=1 Tax=Pseudobythopirellula maris TaxID=2527991 RepID=A0A5C5ZVB0_9BACT|nr:TIGR04086 family membrane protein [Pseudobythopirellula maris]TWT90937.1 hypothetical protein Mal64_13360 [Pseudobythopirellula maris]